MKRKILVVAVMNLLLLMVACGGNTQNNETNAQEGGKDTVIETQENIQNDLEISMESLKNAEDTDVENLEYTILENVVTITGCKEDVEMLVIPNEIEGCPVVKIGKEAFKNNEILKAVRIGDNITTIRDAAFVNCISLKYVIFGDAVEIVEDHSFTGCFALTEVVLNEGLTVIEEMAFSQDIVNPLIIPRSVTEIGSAALGINTPVEVYAGSPAEKLVEEYAQKYTGFTYEVIE